MTPPVVHLRQKGLRSIPGQRAFPLAEAPDLAGKPPDLRMQAVVDFLDVTRSARYQPGNGQTHCNIYATDLAYLLGVYLPRVWWTDDALRSIERDGRAPVVIYGVSVRELGANALHNWLRTHGPAFGWFLAPDVATLQTEVNAGALGIINAQRLDRNRSGHIVGVIPESGRMRATRKDQALTDPVQTQAGTQNFARFSGAPRSRWWLGNQFASHVFAYHRLEAQP